MKQKSGYTMLIGGILMGAALFSGCKGDSKPAPAATQTAAPAAPVKIGDETAMLLKDLNNNGDYVNSKEFPSLVKASVVFENLGPKQLVVDIRTPAAFASGHIKGAVTKRFEDLPAFFESGIKPFEFDKIVLVSDDGQVAAYTTCLLRLMGYGNVYALRWGMSSWNKSFADAGWLQAVKANFEDKLDTSVASMPVAAAMPELATGKTTGADIGADRFASVFKDGTGSVMIDAATVFADPSKYYIINYERKDKYEAGHIPGAVRYKPDGTLGIVSEMATIPMDKTVVVYCGTGHNSGFVTAYLRLFGYDARTLAFGNNGFMHEKMAREKAALSWLPFTAAEVHDYPVVK
jgi:rhodanese-related sulfurtransferase